MRAMKDSGVEWIGSIPAGWGVERMQWHADEVNVSNDPIQTEQVLSLTNKLGVIPYEEKGNQGNKSKVNIVEYKLAYPDTIVANSMNVIIGSVGISKYFGCVSPVYYVFKAKENTDLRFLNYIFQTTDFQKELRKYANGILEIRLRVSASNILKRPIPVPPLSEQRAIARYLDARCADIDEAVRRLSDESALLSEYKRALITECVTRGLDRAAPLRPSGVEWIGSIPAGWGVERIANLYSERNEKVSDKDYPPLSVTKQGILPQIETAAKTNDGDNRKCVHIGDFAINSRSDRRGSCGISKYEGSVSLINIVLMPKENIDPTYFDWLFHTTEFADEFYRWGHGIVDDLWTTNWQDMKKLIIPVPPLSEQRAIARYLDEKCADIDEAVRKCADESALLSEYKRALITECVTGRREVAS